MSYNRGLELVLATLNNADVTLKVKSCYGPQNNWYNKKWKYADIFGENCKDSKFYLEFVSMDRRRHWTYGCINNINDIFNQPNFTEKIYIDMNTLSI